MNKKYEFTGETKRYAGATLHRIRRISDGLVGGWIEKEENLSHEGGCFVYGNAKVQGNAIVFEDAKIYGDAWISGSVRVSGNAEVYEGAWVFWSAWVSGDARVHGDAWVYGSAKISGSTEVCGDARIFSLEALEIEEGNN